MTLSPAQITALQAIFSETELLLDLLPRTACSTDASFYRLIPQAVLRPCNPGQIQRLLKEAATHGFQLTFRGGGTSLSGQAIGEGLLVQLGGPAFSQFQVLDGGMSFRSGPAVRGALINRWLQPHGRALGPDPASIQAASLGGILANNASGMCCGTRFNSYRCLRSMTFVLADGYRLDSAQPGAAERFRLERPDLAEGLRALRQELLGSPALVERIRRKYRIKNTSGYGLNSLIDWEEPLDLLTHLLVGSEGTLAFIEEAVLSTIAELPARATALALFPDLQRAAAAAARFSALGSNAVELMDDSSLRAAHLAGNLPFDPAEGQAALLVEVAAADFPQLDLLLPEHRELLRSEGLQTSSGFTSDSAHRAALWKMRKDLFPVIGGSRPAGTALITEDLCVDPPSMPELIGDLKAAFRLWGFADHVIFGHAKDGNLHFVMHAELSKPAVLERYASFMEQVCGQLVRSYDGSLKAEHGTGRNMAPFLELEWGPELYRIMRSVKQLLDPHGILNPGVLINDDPLVHLRSIKCDRPVDPAIDRCMDCGFCEPVCPSRTFTLTPRGRIAAWRAGFSAKAPLFRHLVEESCAADGMCGLACPLGIDTGAWVKQQRSRRHTALSRFLAKQAARHLAQALPLGRLGTRWIHRLRDRPAGHALLRALQSKVPGRSYDLADGPLAAAAAASHLPEKPGGKGLPVLLFPSCLTRLFAGHGGGGNSDLLAAVLKLLRAAGYSPFTPKELRGACCGMPFHSKGFAEAGHQAQQRTRHLLERFSGGATIPIVCETSPCARELALSCAPLIVEDLLAFLARVSDRLSFQKRGTAILHPVCSTIKSGLLESQQRLVSAAAHCLVPASWNCCGMAGDRGLLLPSLPKYATEIELGEIRAWLQEFPGAQVVSTCVTCESALAKEGLPVCSLPCFLAERLITKEID
jgi:D-lactate dehydrogenase